MRFKTQLGLHSAYKQSINVPVSLLANYRTLGLDNNLLTYILQIMVAYWRGEEANHARIARAMGCKERTLRGYNNRLQEAELAQINGRYMHGNRLENDYDLTPLLDAAAMLALETEREQDKQRNAYQMMEQLVTSMENGEDVSGLLLSLAAEWRTEEALEAEKPTGKILPVETGNILPVETGKELPLETGNNLPVSIGNSDPVSTGKQLPVVTSSELPEKSCRLKPAENCRSNVVGSPQSLKENNNNINRKLSAVGLENGAVRTVIKKAIDLWGEESLAAIEGWIAYVSAQDGLHNPAGLIYTRIVKDGLLPPETETAVSTANDVSEPNEPEVKEI